MRKTQQCTDNVQSCARSGEPRIKPWRFSGLVLAIPLGLALWALIFWSLGLV